MNNALAERAHYYSTACLHLKHGECRGSCQFCSRPCGCECHKSPAPAGRATEENTMSSTYDPNTEPETPGRGDTDPDESEAEAAESYEETQSGEPQTEPAERK